MARTYDRKQRKWVDDSNDPLRPIDARMGDAMDAGSLGYTNISRGMDGKIDSAKDATGQVVQFINGQAPERVQLSQQSQGFSSPLAPLSAAQLALRGAPASLDGRLPAQPVSSAPVALAGTPAASADAMRQAAGFVKQPARRSPIAPYVGTESQILGQRAQAAATQASLRSTPPPPVYGKVQQAPAFSDPLRPASEVSRVTDADGIFTAHTADGGTVTGAGPMSQGAAKDPGIFVDGKRVTHDGRGNLVADIPRPSLDAAAQKDIVSQYPEVANAGSWANTKFTAGLKPGVNTPAAAQDVLAGLTVKPFDLAKSVPSLNGTFGANTSPIAPHVRPIVPDPRGTGEPANPFPPGYAAGQSARTGLAQGAGAAASAFDSTASKVGGTLSSAENTVRGFVGASPAIASGASIKAADDYMANNPTVAGGPRPGFTPSSGNMAGGYDLNALAARAKTKLPASPIAPVQPATPGAMTPKPLDPLAVPAAFNPQPLSLSATAPAKSLDPLRPHDPEELKRRRAPAAVFNPQPLSLSATAPAKSLDPLRPHDPEELKRRRAPAAL